MARRPKKHIERILALKAKFWPEIHEKEYWNRHTNDGFITIPRTMPIILSIIDDLTKNHPAGSTYFELWGRAFDEMYVSLSNPDIHAHHAGFSGQRARRIWQQRMDSLVELGFIKTVVGSAGKHSHAVIIHPHLAIKRLKDSDHPGLTEAKYNSLFMRATEVGAPDISIDPTIPEVQADEIAF